MKKFKLIAFDVDGTLTTNTDSLWLDCNLAFGMTKKEDDWYYQQFHSGKISYQKWISILFKLWKQRSNPAKKNFNVFNQKIKLQSNVKKVLSKLRERGCKIAFVSASTPPVLQFVSKKLKPNYTYGCLKFEFLPNGTLKKIKVTGDEIQFKTKALKEMALKEKIGLNEIMFVGNSLNDLQAFKIVGKAVLINTTHKHLRGFVHEEIQNLSEILKWVK